MFPYEPLSATPKYSLFSNESFHYQVITNLIFGRLAEAEVRLPKMYYFFIIMDSDFCSPRKKYVYKHDIYKVLFLF